ncbi:hypothetical protein Trydic_g23647 [Trypoxylus dichotomus]
MPAIVLYYGPYEAHGMLKHRVQRLHGLIQHLTEQKYEVELVPFLHLNRLVVKMLGTVVFRCDIRSLLFNVDYESDVVCQRVAAAIKETEKRLYDNENIPRFTLIEDIKRNRGKVTGQELFGSKLLFEHAEELLHQRLKKKSEVVLFSLEDSTIIRDQMNWSGPTLPDFAESIITDILGNAINTSSEMILENFFAQYSVHNEA